MSERLRFAFKVKGETIEGKRESDMTTAKTIFVDSDISPAPEFVSHDIDPKSQYSGEKRKEFITPFATFPLTIETFLPLNEASFDSSAIDTLLAISSLKRTLTTVVPDFTTTGALQSVTVAIDTVVKFAAASGSTGVGVVDVFYKSLTAQTGIDLDVVDFTDTTKWIPTSELIYKFTPDTYSTSTASIDLVSTSMTFKAAGAKASLKSVMDAGGIIKLTFEIKAVFIEKVSGVFTVPTASVPPKSVIDDNGLYGSVTVAGVAIEADKLSLDMSSTLTHRKTFSSNMFYMSEYQPTIDIGGYLDADHDFDVNELVDGTTKELIVTIKDNKDSGKVKWVITASKLKLDETPNSSDNEGLYYLDKKYAATSTTGDDGFSIQYFV